MSRRPLTAAALCLMAGLWLGRYIYLPWPLTLALSLCALAGLIAATIWENRRRRWIAGLLFSFLVGWCRITPLAYPQLPATHITHWIDRGKVTVQGTLKAAPQIDADGHTRLELDAERIVFAPNRHTTARGRLRITGARDLPTVEIGDRVRLTTDVRPIGGFRTPGAVDSPWLAQVDGFLAQGYVRSGETIEIVERGSFGFLRSVERLRGGIARAAQQKSPANAPYVLALVLGEPQMLSAQLRDAFRDVGLSHLLAISGLHVTAIAGLVFSLSWILLARFRRLALRFQLHRFSALIAFPFPLLYALLAGGSVSVVRAGLLYLMFFLGVWRGQRRDMYIALAFAAILILLVKPGYLWRPAFQLSFAAVLGFAHFRPLVDESTKRIGWQEKLTRHPRLLHQRQRFLRGAGYSLAAILATMPITAWHFGAVAPAGLIANLAGIPIFAMLVIPALIAGTIVLPWSSTLAHFCWTIAAGGIEQVYGMALLLREMGVTQVFIGRPSLPELAAVAVLLLVMPYWRERRMWMIAAAASLVLIAVPLGYLVQPHLQREMKVTMLDVGQGLSLLAEIPGGKRLLFDGGGLPYSDFDIGRAVVLPFLAAKRIRRLDVVVASHGHPDHYRGLQAVLETIPVKELWCIKTTRAFKETGPYLYLIQTARARSVNVRMMDSSQSPFKWGEAEAKVLNPPAEQPPNWDLNDLSLALKLTCRGRSVLFCADMGRKAEWLVLSKAQAGKIGLVQVGHHGSDTSSEPAFIDSLRATDTLISVGRYNRYGHPSANVIRLWEKSGASVWRTDYSGTVECIGKSKYWQCNPLLSGR